MDDANSVRNESNYNHRKEGHDENQNHENKTDHEENDHQNENDRDDTIDSSVEEDDPKDPNFYPGFANPQTSNLNKNHNSNVSSAREK